MVTLKQLRYFDAVARLGHFGRAADACAITQPALSIQIKALEEALGGPLFERLADGARLTAPGEEIAHRVASILIDLHDLCENARLGRTPFGGLLKFGVIPSIAPYLLPLLVPKLQRKYPQAALNIRESQTDTLVAELNNGQLDVLLLALPIRQQNIETLALFEDPFVLVAPAQHADRISVRSPDELISNERLLLLEEGHCFRDQALAYCTLRKSRKARTPGYIDTFGASTLATVVQLVACGLGVTFLPQMALAIEGGVPGVRMIRLASPEPSRTIGLCWRRSAPWREHFADIGKLVSESWHTLQQNP